MNDLERYIKKRKKTNPEFAKGFDAGYRDFKIGVILRQAREEAGLTQEELADRVGTRKTAISRRAGRKGTPVTCGLSSDPWITASSNFLRLRTVSLLSADRLIVSDLATKTHTNPTSGAPMQQSATQDAPT